MVETETKIIQLEQKATPRSTLHLFQYKGLELANLQERASAGLQLEENFSRTELSLGKLHKAKNARLDRLSETNRELSEQLDNSSSSISCGAVYLKMRSELPNLSSNDFMEFFNLCLRFNTLLNEQSMNSINTNGEQATLLKSLSMMNARRKQPELKKISDAMIDNPPEWFKNNKRDWQMFVAPHATFTFYLNSHLLKSLATGNLPVKQILEEPDKNSYGFTKQGEFPDWFLEESGILPTKEEVEEELAEDKEQEIITLSALEKIKEQRDYLITTCTEKTQKAIARLSDLAEEAFPNIENFADMILFLDIVRKTRIFTVPFEKTIKDYAQSYDILKISEPIALYIEKKLLQGKIVQSAQDPIDAHFIDLFSTAFESIKAQQEDGSKAAEFEALRTTDKKAFGTLNYDIKPFLEVLSEQDLSFLSELLLEYRDTSAEQFIWDMAGLISSHIKREEIQLSKSQLGALHDLSRITATFLRNHSEFAYEELHKSSRNLQEQEKLKPKDSSVTANLQEEIKSATEEIAQGNLAGWHIFYTDNKTADPNHLSEIEGESLAQREEVLGKFFQNEHISSSVKTGSIIRALEWIVGVPQEIEQVRMTEEIAGKVFKKVKRGNLRIFYILDTAQKKIIFFTHQKKAWSYGF